ARPGAGGEAPRPTSRCSLARSLRAPWPLFRSRRPSEFVRHDRHATNRMPDAIAYSTVSPCARKNDRLSSDTVRSRLFNFTPRGTLIAPGEKLRIALTPAATTMLTTCWAEV